MSENSNFICLTRSLIEKSSWYDARPTHQTVFMAILLRCAYKATEHNIKGNIITILPGQLCATFRQIQDWAGKWITKNDVEGALRYFTKVNFLRQEIRHGKTLITITELDIYNTFVRSNQTTNQMQVRQKSDIKEQRQERKEEQQQTRESFQNLEIQRVVSPVVVAVDFSNESFKQEEDFMHNTPEENIPISIHPALKDLNLVVANESHKLSLDSQISFSKEFSSDTIEKAVKYVSQYKNPISSLGGFLRRAMQNNYEVVKSKEDKKKEVEIEKKNLQTEIQKRIECNKKFAKSFEDCKSDRYEIRINSNDVKFHDFKGNKHYILDYRELGFKHQFNLTLLKCEIYTYSKIDDNVSNLA